MSGGFSAWREANVTDDPTILDDARAWFDRVWKEAAEISDADIEDARRVWTERRKLAPTRHGTSSLFDAYADDPALFRCVHCIVIFEENLDAGAEKQREQFEQEHPFLTYTFRWWWQPTTPLQQEFWLIRCDFTDSRHPKISGYARMPNPLIRLPTGRKNEHDVYPVVRESALKIGTKSYKLAAQERTALLKNLASHALLKNAEGHDIVVSFSDVITEQFESNAS